MPEQPKEAIFSVRTKITENKPTYFTVPIEADDISECAQTFADQYPSYEIHSIHKIN